MAGAAVEDQFVAGPRFYFEPLDRLFGRGAADNARAMDWSGRVCMALVLRGSVDGFAEYLPNPASMEAAVSAKARKFALRCAGGA